jgi:hypothetical protein
MKWKDVHSGKEFNVTTTLSPQRGLVRIKSIRDVFEEYEFHPEPKSAAPDGEAADQRTCGLLARARCRTGLHHIRRQGIQPPRRCRNQIVHDWDDVQQRYEGTHATGSAERRAQ